MSGTSSDILLAVDGGGSRCRAAVSVAGRVATAETGPSNVSTDFDGALSAVLAAMDAAARAAGLSMEDLAEVPAFVGLAGVTGPEMAARVAARLPLAAVRVEDDRPAAVRGALGARDGVVAHCGTGSFLAAQEGLAMRFAGGWGPVLGDEASAQWVGRTALRLTLQSVDGWRSASGLSEGILAEMGGSAGVVRFAGQARPSDFGALAPRVTAAAEAGDAMAAEVVALGAGEIARGVTSMGWKPGRAICLTGGIGPFYAPYLPDPMRRAVMMPEGAPIDGALLLAAEVR